MSKLTVRANADVENFPVTQFTEFDYLGLTSFNGQLVMCDASGIYTHSGSDDNGVDIDAWFEIATTDFDILNQKRIRAVLGSGLFSGDIILSVAFDDGSFDDYAVSESQQLNQSVWKRFINREQVGAHVKIKISNVDGADFSIDTLTAVIILLHNLPMDRALALPRSRVTIATSVGTLIAAMEIS